MDDNAQPALIDAHNLLLKSQTSPAIYSNHIEKKMKNDPEALCLTTVPPTGYHYPYGTKQKQQENT
jgi:hypothetical protein